jgi:hypothetical protein
MMAIRVLNVMQFSCIEMGCRCIEKKRIVIIVDAGRWDLGMHRRRNLKPKSWRRGVGGRREMVWSD